MEPTSFEDRYDWAVLYRQMRQTLAYLNPDLHPTQLNTLAEALARKTVDYLQPFMRDYEAVSHILASLGHEVSVGPGEFNRMSHHLRDFLTSLTTLSSADLERLAQLLNQYEVPQTDADGTLMALPARISWLGRRLSRAESLLAEAMEAHLQLAPDELLKQVGLRVEEGSKTVNQALAEGLRLTASDITAHIAATAKRQAESHQDLMDAIQLVLINQDDLPQKVRQVLVGALASNSRLEVIEHQLSELTTALHREKSPEELVEEALPSHTAIQVHVDEMLRQIRKVDERFDDIKSLLQDRQRETVGANRAASAPPPAPQSASAPAPAPKPPDPAGGGDMHSAINYDYTFPISLEKVIGFWNSFNGAEGESPLRAAGYVILGFLQLAVTILTLPLVMVFVLYRCRRWSHAKKLLCQSRNERPCRHPIFGAWWVLVLPLTLMTYVLSTAMVTSQFFSGPLPTGFAGWMEAGAYQLHFPPVEEAFGQTANQNLEVLANRAFQRWNTERAAPSDVYAVEDLLLMKGAITSTGLVKTGNERLWQQFVSLLEREGRTHILNAPLERAAAQRIQGWLLAPSPAAQQSALSAYLVARDDWTLNQKLYDAYQTLAKSGGINGKLISKTGQNHGLWQRFITLLSHSGARPGSVGSQLDLPTARALHAWLTGYLPPTVPDRLSRIYDV